MNFGSPKPKKPPKTNGKALPREGFRITFRQVKNLIQPMEKQLFRKSEKAIRKLYENLSQMADFWSKIAKWYPKTLKKHYLEKVFVSRFRKGKTL